MLDPYSRRHLLDVLRPPPGYALDYAVGTTYSLDLLALLTAPLAFSMLHREEDADVASADPIALLESIRRHTDRITIFCQAGQILVPRTSQLLYGYLESSVIEVTPQRADRAFHPKLWVLRFRPYQEGDPLRYRLLCLSRNLTFDRSWDTALVLEGELTERQRGYGRNRPLGEFIAALPGLAIHPVAVETAQHVAEIGAEVRRVQFDVPVGFQEFSFHPLGLLRRRHWPFNQKADRLLVISPFVADTCLEELVGQAQESVLVSRLESLQAADQATISEFDQVFILNDAVNVEYSDISGPDVKLGDGEEPTMAEQQATDTALRGLHAKLYVLNRGWYTDIWTGSANATNAAFNGNVEFLVRLHGKRSQCGIDTILGAADETGLRRFLEPYVPADEAERDEIAEALDDRITTTRRAIVAARITGQVHRDDGDDSYAVALIRLEEMVLPDGVQVCCWPITLRPETAGAAVAPHSGTADLVQFDGVSFQALTTFFAFELVATVAGRVQKDRFVLNVPLVGLPDNRNERLLHAMLENRGQVLRLILLLLMEGEPNVAAILATLRENGLPTQSRGLGEGQIPLFETMIRALDRNPARLDAVASLITQLRKTDEGSRLLPEQLDSIWQPIWATRRKLMSD